jgi:RNA polymerase-binding transcription factor DksA
MSGRRGVGGTPAWIESARARLEEQRSFRARQIEELAGGCTDGVLDAGSVEVQQALRAAAVAALADVDAALRRIEQGTYGRCSSCAGMVSRARLEAVPSAPLCGTCHHARDVLGSTPLS